MSGAFEMVSGDENLFYDTIPKNTTYIVSGSITVRVKAVATPGDVVYAIGYWGRWLKNLTWAHTDTT